MQHVHLTAPCLRRLLPVCCPVQAEAVEVKLKQEQAEKLALHKEVLQLRLLKDEAEASAKQLREQLTDANRALTRETAEHQATSAALSDLRASLESREQQLGDARQLLDSMSAELGILASRLHRLQQERDALHRARQQAGLRWVAAGGPSQSQLSQPNAQSSPRPQRQLTSCQLDALQPLSGAAAAAAQLQMAGQASSSSRGGGAGIALAAAGADPYATDGSTVDSQSFVDCISDALQPPAASAQQQALPAQLDQVVPVAHLPRFNGIPTAGSTSRGSSPTGLESDSCLLHNMPDTAPDEPAPLCAHGQIDGACLLCMCTRFLEATAGSYSHWVPGSSLSAAAARLSNSGSCLPNPAAAGEGASSSRGLLPAAAGGPTAAGLATAAVAACASEAAQYRQYLAISELARNRLEAEHATLQQQVDELRQQVQQQQHELQVLQAHPAALTACSIEELTALEGRRAHRARGSCISLGRRKTPPVPASLVVTWISRATRSPHVVPCCPFCCLLTLLSARPPACRVVPVCLPVPQPRHARGQHQGGAPGGPAAQHRGVPAAGQRRDAALCCVHGGQAQPCLWLRAPDL